MLYLPLLLLTVAACNSWKDLCISHNKAFPAHHVDTFQKQSTYFSLYARLPQIVYSKEGVTLSIARRYDNPELVSDGYIRFGKVEAEIRSLDGPGIISSFYLQSDDLDEIDVVEIIGSFPETYQTNYFVKGNTTTYDRGDTHTLPTSPHDNYHKYGVEWTDKEIIWFLDNAPVRRLPRENSHGFPTSPMRVYFSVWAGGDSLNAPGTILWAGGPTDYRQMPYRMDIRSVLVENYLPGGTFVYGSGLGVSLVQVDSDEVDSGRGSENSAKGRNFEKLSGTKVVYKSMATVLRPVNRWIQLWGMLMAV